MARNRTIAAAALTLTTLLGVVGASSGAPIPPPTAVATAAPTLTLKRNVFVPNVAPVRPGGLVFRPRDPAAKPVASTTDAGTKPPASPTATATTTATTAPADAGSGTPTTAKAVAVLSAAQKAAVVDKMNSLRASLGASSMQTITWDDNLAAFAATVAGQCQLAHSSSSDRTNITGWVGTYVGEELAAGSPASLADATNAATVSADLDTAFNMWWSEKAYYDYATNTCAAGQICGHYTQIAWAQTRSVGCAVVMCVPHSMSTSAYSVVCELGPGGNILGQRPY